MPEETTPSTEVATTGQLPIDIPSKPDANGKVTLEKPVVAATPSTTDAPAKEQTPTKEVGKGDAPAVVPATAPAAAETIGKTEHQQIIDSIKAGHDGTVSKMKEDIVTLKKAQETAAIASEEAQIAQFLAPYKAEGTTEELTRADSLAEAQRLANKAVRELSNQKVDLDAREVLLNEAGRGKAVADYMTQYNLGAESKAELEKASDLKVMENVALKLALEQSKTQQRPAETVDKAPAKTTGMDLKNVPLNTRLGMAAEHQI